MKSILTFTVQNKALLPIQALCNSKSLHIHCYYILNETHALLSCTVMMLNQLSLHRKSGRRVVLGHGDTVSSGGRDTQHGEGADVGELQPRQANDKEEEELSEDEYLYEPTPINQYSHHHTPSVASNARGTLVGATGTLRKQFQPPVVNARNSNQQVQQCGARPQVGKGGAAKPITTATKGRKLTSTTATAPAKPKKAPKPVSRAAKKAAAQKLSAKLYLESQAADDSSDSESSAQTDPAGPQHHPGKQNQSQKHGQKQKQVRQPSKQRGESTDSCHAADQRCIIDLTEDVETGKDGARTGAGTEAPGHTAAAMGRGVQSSPGRLRQQRKPQSAFLANYPSGSESEEELLLLEGELSLQSSSLAVATAPTQRTSTVMNATATVPAAPQLATRPIATISTASCTSQGRDLEVAPPAGQAVATTTARPTPRFLKRKFSTTINSSAGDWGVDDMG